MLNLGQRAALEAALARRRRQRVLHAVAVERQHAVARRRRRDRRAESARPRRRVRAVELRSAPSVHRQPDSSSCRSGLVGGGSTTRRAGRHVVGGWTATLVVHRAVGHAVHDARRAARRSTSRRAPTARCARTHGLRRSRSPIRAIADFFNTARSTTACRSARTATRRATSSIGPGSHQLNGTLVRDIRLGGNRDVTLQINATNLLNTVPVARRSTPTSTRRRSVRSSPFARCARRRVTAEVPVLNARRAAAAIARDGRPDRLAAHRSARSRLAGSNRRRPAGLPQHRQPGAGRRRRARPERRDRHRPDRPTTSS